MNMDKNQARSVVRTYLYNEHFFPAAEKELEEIKKITDLQEQQKKANVAYNYHASYSQLATSHCRNYKLSEEVINAARYEEIVSEFYNIVINSIEQSGVLNQGEKKNNYSCEYCKKNKTGQYWYRTFNGRQTMPKNREQQKFCSQKCLNSWNQNNLKEQNNSEITCHQCNKFFSGQYWYKNNSRESIIHKFCSQECSNAYWTKKQCSGSDCSNLLTSEEICYCIPCHQKQEQILKDLDKNSQDIKKDLENFNQGLNGYAEDQKKSADEKGGSNSNSINNKDNNSIRERERERERPNPISTITITLSNHHLRI